ncbi:aldo/keto reductase [Kineosporia mesophila]|uniref:Aldo/keto reductase n=1 Tax=Kineosporia mesophila TaxID=566012 RepID=A0ABP6ZWK6_9ACTN|nr:aldo/keto reductase [Kineosporia mesophila]MCD5355240.1 aldo/keto reductase [Kineosporia mesophila]
MANNETLHGRREHLRAALKQPQICLGTMYFGTTVKESDAHAILSRFVEGGGRIIDTANCYCFWVEGGQGDESEQVIGRWLAANPSLREEVILATKVGSRPATASSPWPEEAEGLSASVIHQEMERSLERLQTDSIDLYYSHIDDAQTPQEETAAAFGELVSSGRAHLLGASNFTWERLASAREVARAKDLPAYEVVQLRASYLWPRQDADFAPQIALTEEYLEQVKLQDDLRVFGFSPLLSGAYSRADREIPATYRTQETDRRLAELTRAADELGLTANQYVLAHLINRQQITPVIGVSSLAQLDEALATLEILAKADTGSAQQHFGS